MICSDLRSSAVSRKWSAVICGDLRCSGIPLDSVRLSVRPYVRHIRELIETAARIASDFFRRLIAATVGGAFIFNVIRRCWGCGNLSWIISLWSATMYRRNRLFIALRQNTFFFQKMSVIPTTIVVDLVHKK